MLAHQSVILWGGGRTLKKSLVERSEVTEGAHLKGASGAWPLSSSCSLLLDHYEESRFLSPHTPHNDVLPHHRLKNNRIN